RVRSKGVVSAFVAVSFISYLPSAALPPCPIVHRPRRSRKPDRTKIRSAVAFGLPNKPHIHRRIRCPWACPSVRVLPSSSVLSSRLEDFRHHRFRLWPRLLP